MKFTIDKQEKFCVFSLQEDKLISTNGPLFKSEMIILNAEGHRNIILDLSEVKFVDSSGLSAILITDRLCKNADGTFVISGMNEQVYRLMKISQLDTVLHMVRSIQEAKDLVLMEEIERNFDPNEA